MILTIVEEAINAGIEEVAILVQSRDMPLFDALFNEPPAIENFNKLSRENQEYCDYLKEIGQRITFLPQEAQEGFGHAVNCAKEWVDEYKGGMNNFNALYEKDHGSQLEEVGRKLRKMMKWVNAKEV